MFDFCEILKIFERRGCSSGFFGVGGCLTGGSCRLDCVATASTVPMALALSTEILGLETVSRTPLFGGVGFDASRDGAFSMSL